MNNYTSINFFDPQVWQSVMLIGILFASLIAANILKARIPVLGKLLIPNAVLGGIILLIVAYICQLTTGTNLFNMEVFSNGTGISTLEVLTYHCLAIGFIAMTLRPTADNKEDKKKRATAIINTGIATIGTYMIQAILGIGVTVLAAMTINKELASGSGVLLCFGYGQGTGQALNIGKNFDTTLGTSIYSSMGLALAATGFLSACLVGVPYLNLLRKKGLIDPVKEVSGKTMKMEDIQTADEVPMNESVDKMSIQIAVVAMVYMMAYGMMYLIGNVLLGEGSSMLGTIYGFNFLFGVIAAVIYKAFVSMLRRKKQIRREYLNAFLLNRISGFAFDLMIVSGICAIQISKITGLLGIILILSVIGAVITFIYQRFVTHKLFPEYEHYQFLAFFGMLTGTASTGMILLREADPDLKTPVSSNMVYQNLPAMVLAIPLLFIASSLTGNAGDMSNTLKMLALVVAIFVVLNVVLFRSFLFKKKNRK